MKRYALERIIKNAVQGARMPGALVQAREIDPAECASTGFSVNLSGHEPLQWPGAYMVSLADREKTFPAQPSVESLADFISDNMDALVIPGRYVGGWLNNGIWYLDVSVCILGLDSAIPFARANAQQAIFDLWTRKDIFLKDALCTPELREEEKCQRVEQCVRWSPVTTVDRNRADACLLPQSAGADSLGMRGLLATVKPLAGKCQLLAGPSSPECASGRVARDQYSELRSSGGEGVGSH